MNRPLLPLALALVCLLSSCSGGPSWFQGTWELDAKATVDAAMKADGTPQVSVSGDGASKGADKLVGSLLDSLARGIGEALAPKLLASEYDKATVTITGSTITIMKDGSGKELGYKVLDTTGDSITIKTSDDKIATWTKRDAMISTRATQDVKLDLLFKRLK